MKIAQENTYVQKARQSCIFPFAWIEARGNRVNVIRSARKHCRFPCHSESLLSPHVADDRRAQIAVAAYRLLDPRERNDLYERVQLVFPIDREDMDIPVIAANTLVDQMQPCRACYARAKKGATES